MQCLAPKGRNALHFGVEATGFGQDSLGDAIAKMQVQGVRPPEDRRMHPANFRIIALSVVLVCLLEGTSALTAQQGQGPKMSEEGANPSVASAVRPPEAVGAFHIGAGDVLHVSVWREDALTQNAVVRTDGRISLPLISEVSVAGKTTLDVQEMLTEKYSAFLTRPEVTVTVTEVNSQIVYILGEVQKPGAYPFVQSVGVLQLIARAGGLTPYAKKHSIYLLQGAQHQRTAVNFDKLVKGEGPGASLLLSSGDTVVVP
jgi:polysaccharide export outer membrane protein